jgi:predicted aldo/keto reductase-like oxidoreductase
MQYRVVPKNGDKLSVLGFGCMRLPMKGEAIDEERAIKQIRYAIDHGVNYVDTAPPYHGGESEKVLGKALLDDYRDKVKIATKLSPFMLSEAGDMERMLDKQLEKLQTDHIDYYLLHGLDADYWNKLQGFGALEFLDRAQADGRIVNQCFSFHGTLKTFKEIIDANDWTMCQIQYNFLDERMQAGTEGLKYAASKKIAVVVMEPLRGGLLASNVPKEVRQIYDRAGVDRNPAAWALRWVWNHPEVTLLLSGMNEESQIVENLRTAETALPNSLNPEELSILKNAAEAYHDLLKVPCTGCQYCMPCPSGVNIPLNFQVYNEYHMGSDKEKSRDMYAMLLMGGLNGKRADAELCEACDQCRERCPQHIDISEKLKAVAKELGGERTLAVAKEMRAKKAAGRKAGSGEEA